MQLETKTLAAMRVATMRHTGPYGDGGIRQLWKRFMPWCHEHAGALASWQTYGISLDDPQVTPPAQCRYDCAVEVKPGFVPEGGEVQMQDFPGGRYACAWFSGTPETMPAAWRQMFTEWLPASGLQPTGASALELYEADFEADMKTGAFSCWLCVPV